MSKEYLEALQFIVNEALFSEFTKETNIKVRECNDIVRQALKRLESIDNANPSEALKKYETIYDLALAYCEEHNPEIIRSVLETRNDTIKQALLKAQEKHLKDKAFELIILKNVDVNEIRPNATAEAYNSKIPYYRQSLTEEEFRFLKEMVHRLDCEEVLFELPKVY